MDMSLDAFPRFVFQERCAIGFMNSDEADNVSYYVVMAKIYRIVSTTPFGIDLAMADHAGKSLFTLRDMSAGDFFDQHMFQYAANELEQHVYHEAISAVQRREFPTNIGLLSTRDFGAIHPNVDVGFKKRIYAPLQP